MNQLSPDLREDLLEVLDEVSTLMSAEYAQLGPLPDDHPLAQSGLENGAEIVLDYIAHGEAGVALDHLFYMIKEPPLAISARSAEKLARLANALELDGMRSDRRVEQDAPSSERKTAIGQKRTVLQRRIMSPLRFGSVYETRGDYASN